MPGISSTLLERLLATLTRCGPFASDGDLRAAFTDARIAPWADALSHADSPAARVQRTVAFLCDKRDAEGTNGLVLLLRVLADHTVPADACRRDLVELAMALEQVPPEALATLSEVIPSQVQVTLDDSQAGVVGDGARIDGDVHQDSHAAGQHTQADQGGMAVSVGGDVGEAQIAGRDINIHEPEKPAHPWWERFRNHSLIFYPTVVFGILAAIVALISGLIGLGADFGGAYEQFQKWGIIAANTPTSTPTLTPMLTPTPMDFMPARKDETLIIVTDFDDRSAGKYTGIDPAQYIYERLKERIQKDDLDFRVERLDQVVDDNTARPVGKTYNAALVLWGWYDAVGITPRLEHITTIEAIPGCPTCEESGLQLAEPETVEFGQSIFETLPDRTTYLVSFALGLGNYARGNKVALDYFNSAIEIVEQDTSDVLADEAYFYQGNIYLSREQHELAVKSYSRAIELNQDFAMACYNRGFTYNAMGEHEQALADYDRAIELDPEDAKAYNNRGIIYADMGEYERALADYNRAIDLDPAHNKAYNNRGNTYADKGEYEQALADYDRAIELDPEHANAYYSRGLTYYEIGEYERALANYDRALALNPEYAEAYVNRGIIYADKGEYEQALADCDRAIELDPELVKAYVNRGSIYQEMGEYEQALADCDRAIELNPELAEAYLNRGNTYGAMGAYEAALTDFERAADLMMHPFIYYNGAMAHAQLGHVEEACAWLEEAIALDGQIREWVRINIAFDPIRDAACFQALVGEE